MQVKRILLLATCLSTLSIAFDVYAGSSPSKAENILEDKKATLKLKEVDQEIEDILDRAKKIREERDRLEDQADDIENKDPKEAKKLNDDAEVKHKELVDLLYQLENLLKKREFDLRELGIPDDEEDSPYQP